MGSRRPLCAAFAGAVDDVVFGTVVAGNMTVTVFGFLARTTALPPFFAATPARNHDLAHVQAFKFNNEFECRTGSARPVGSNFSRHVNENMI